MTRHPSILVCMPTSGFVRVETMKSLALMFSFFGENKLAGTPSTQRLALATVEGSMLCAQREMLVKKALQTKHITHILFVDSDMEFPMNLIHRLYAHDKVFVGANCTTRAEPVEPVGHDMAGNRLFSTGKTGLQEVTHVGLAIALIQTEPLKDLRPPLFLMDWIPEHRTYCGEDVYFTQKLVEKGHSIWIDHDVSLNIGHVGTRIYKHSDTMEKVHGTEKSEAQLCAA